MKISINKLYSGLFLLLILIFTGLNTKCGMNEM